MKKINRLKDPFLLGTFIDSIGYAVVLAILGFHFEDVYAHPILCVVFLGVLLAYVLFRAMFLMVSLNMLRHVAVLRLCIFNLNIDIIRTKLYVRVFGDRQLYRRRTKLLKDKKRQAKEVYAHLTTMIDVLWGYGYKPDALLLVLQNMLYVGPDADKLTKRYRSRARK